MFGIVGIDSFVGFFEIVVIVDESVDKDYVFVDFFS